MGARPQFIKAAVVSHALSRIGGVHEVLVHTGQHFDANMSQIFLDELAIPKVDYHLGIVQQTHGKQTAAMIIAIEEILFSEKPDWVLIYGDTNSTLAAAVAAAKLHIPIAHVEAGLRSYNRTMPEEINRLIADQLARTLFSPTKQAVKNLLHEGYVAARILEVGDVMYDAAIFYAEKSERESKILNTLHLTRKDYILATIHRAENTDDPGKLKIIFSALNAIANTLSVVIPLHPRTRKELTRHYPELLLSSNIQFIDPVGFLDMIMLEKNASLIVTDSGGVQKEAFFYQVPCVTLRDETEWVETVDLQWNCLTPPLDVATITESILKNLNTQGLLGHYPYGKGNAATLIANYLKSFEHSKENIYANMDC